MNKAMHSVMLSCDKATFFVTKKEYVKLSCKENVQLKMHLMGCKLCRSFDDQNAILSEKIKTLQINPPPVKLTEVKKQEIQETLDQNK
jgi:hypothetical protein